MKKVFPNNTESPDEIIRDLCNREGDVAGMREMQYRGVVLDVYRDMNLYAIKYTKRYWLPVDKLTNTIITPDDFMILSSLSAPNDCGKLITLVLNKNISTDVIDLTLDHDCKCECGCKSDLCGLIKYYEPIVETVYELLPDQTYGEFTAITRKKLEGNILYTEKTYPIIKYGAAGEHVATGLVTETQKLCQLDVKECGCIKDTEENKCALDECCGADTFATDCGHPTCPTESPEGFNFNENGSRIELPSTFTAAKALIRYYAEANMSDLRIPVTAKQTFIYGLKSYITEFEERTPMWKMDRFSDKYEDGKKKLFTLYNRFSLKKFMQVTSPNIVMP